MLTICFLHDLFVIFVQLRKRLTVSTVFIHGNYDYANRELTRILRKATDKQGRNIHIVTEGSGNISGLPFKVSSIQYILLRNASDYNYDMILHTTGYEDGDVVLLMCDQLGQILASEWAHQRPMITFLDLGSFWDFSSWKSLRLDISRPCMYRHDIAMNSTALPSGSKRTVIRKWILKKMRFPI